MPKAASTYESEIRPGGNPECPQALDAKAKFDDDVPDEVMDLALWMLRSADTLGIEFVLCGSLAAEAHGTRKARSKKILKLREPLDGVFRDLVHSWIVYVSNKNLFARFMIRAALGRMLEKDEKFSSYSAGIVSKVAVKQDPCFSAVAA